MEDIQALIDERIEALASEVMVAVRAAAIEALSGALGGQGARSRGPAKSCSKRKARGPRVIPRRTSEELAKLGERLYEQIDTAPGETMTVYSKRLGATAAELAVPIHKLRKAGRVRKAGERSDTQYFPMGTVAAPSR